MIKCNELIGKSSIDFYYEFLFTMALAAECGRRGTSLDMSMMKVFDKSMLSANDLAYMQYLKDTGSIYDGTDNCKKFERGSADDVISKRPKYFFDVNAVSELYDVLFEEREDCYLWSRNHSFQMYGNYANDLVHMKKTGNTILHLMAHMLICFKLGERIKKVVRFYFKNFEVKSIHMYIDLLACMKTLDALKGIVTIDFDENYAECVSDIDFNILYAVSIHANRMKKWSCSEKFDVFKKYGFEKGSIAVLYERDRISENNPLGSIVRASIVRIDDYNDDLYSRAGWYLTKYSVNKTIEESEDDYYGMDEEWRGAFSDLLKPYLGESSSFISFENLGIGTYFCDEEFILMPLERDEKVHKKVSIDGKLVTVELDDVEVIYWILNQYGVNFDKELYKKYYNKGQPLMWDKYDCTPVHRTD